MLQYIYYDWKKGHLATYFDVKLLVSSLLDIPVGKTTVTKVYYCFYPCFLRDNNFQLKSKMSVWREYYCHWIDFVIKYQLKSHLEYTFILMFYKTLHNYEIF